MVPTWAGPSLFTYPKLREIDFGFFSWKFYHNMIHSLTNDNRPPTERHNYISMSEVTVSSSKTAFSQSEHTTKKLGNGTTFISNNKDENEKFPLWKNSETK